MKKVTKEFLIEKGFKLVPSIIQDSFEYIMEDVNEESDWSDERFVHYRSCSMSLCNDKGEGEYYFFLREGSTTNRHEDTISSISRSILYEEEVLDLLRLLGN